jgi:UTP-glucose-1-phosphate uridylyltransferase
MIAVIPAAGLGTRLLPLTRSVPKELLPVGNRPAIQWVLQEVYEAGITGVVIVSSSRKPALREFLTQPDNHDPRHGRQALKDLKQLLQSLQIIFVEQSEPRGLRDAVWQCKSIVGGKSFALVMPDNVSATAELLSRLLQKHASTANSCVALYPQTQSCRHLESSRYVLLTRPLEEGVFRINKAIPASDARVHNHEFWRIGIGRSIFAARSLDLFAPREPPVDTADDSEVCVLNTLAEQNALLGVEATEDIWHIGSMEIYTAAFEHFARNGR